jgi:DNA-binding NarL/FixJ family response regulator
MQLNPIKVLVVHGSPVAHAGLVAGFSKYGDIEILNPLSGTGPGPAREAPTADVVVADYERGIEWVRREHGQRLHSRQRVIIVTPSDRESDIRHALDCGARGYMLLDSDFDDLAHGVREVHMGARALSRRIAQQLAQSVSAEKLTCRELEVLRLVVKGDGNKTIARHLDVAVGTVKSHLKSIFQKLDVKSRTQAIAVALRRGLLPGTSSTEGGSH